MVPAGVTARAGALGAERGLFLPRRAPHPRAQVGQTPLPFLPRLLLDLQAHAPPSALGCWAEGPGTLGQLRPQEWSGPVGWALASGLARVVPLRAAGKALPWAPQQGLEGWFPGSHCFLCVCSHSHGSCTVPARRPPLLASTLPSRGRGKAQEPASGDSHPGGWGRAAWGPLPGARATGAQGAGRQTPTASGTPRPPGGQGSGGVRARAGGCLLGARACTSLSWGRSLRGAPSSQRGLGPWRVWDSEILSGAGVAGAGAAASLSAPASPAGQALSPLLTWAGGAHLSPWHSRGASGMGATGRPGLGREAELPPCLGRVWVFSATRTPRPQTGH